VSALAGAYALYTIFERIFLGDAPQGFTALIVAITFFAGVQLLFLGLIGEYLGRVYDEAKGRPNFVVTEVVKGSGAVDTDYDSVPPSLEPLKTGD